MDKKLKFWILLATLVIPIGLLITSVIFLYALADYFFIRYVTEGVIVVVSIFVALILYTICFIVLLKKIGTEYPQRKPIIGIYSILSVAMISVIVVGSFIAIPYARFGDYSAGPIITWGTGQDPRYEISVVWWTDSEIQSVVNYGTSKDNLDKTANSGSNENWHTVAIDSLQANTKYYYRVNGMTEASIKSFTTAPDSDQDFTFLVYSDPRQNSGPMGMIFQPNVPQAMDNDMKSQGITPAFTLCTGDVVSEATTESMWMSWIDDLSKTSDLGSTAPMQIATGNHERHQNCDGDIWESRMPYEASPYFNYSYDYANIHVLVLDPWNYTTCYWGEPINAEQLTWAQEDLQAAQSKDYRIVALHPPPVLEGETWDNMEDIVDLCNDYNVDVCFFGHKHRFEYSQVGPTHYCLVGVGGNNGELAQPSGYVQVDVTSTDLSINMKWLNGTELTLATLS